MIERTSLVWKVRSQHISGNIDLHAIDGGLALDSDQDVAFPVNTPGFDQIGTSGIHLGGHVLSRQLELLRFGNRCRLHYSYCAMQGEIFMAAVDLGYSMEDFAPMYMCSQLAGVMDHSFSRAGKMDEDGVAGMLKLPLLLKSPETIVAVALWLNHIVEGRALNESPTEAVALSASKTSMALAEDTDAYEGLSFDALADAYEYAYWLGYIYRFECLLHEESSRMVYGAFSEAFMRETWNAMAALLRDVALRDYADRICRKLVGKLWPTLRLPQAASLAMGTTA